MGDMILDHGSALVVVDVQNDFAHPDGSLYVDGGEAIIPTINRLIGEARRHGALVAYTQDWHPPETPHFSTQGGTWPVHCVRDTWGAQLHDDLDVGAGGPVVRKGTGGEDGYSGFTARDVTTGEDRPTALEARLRDHGVERVLVVGLAEDVCVKATALDARRLGFDTAVALDATRPVEIEPGDGLRARNELAAAGITLEGAAPPV
jgi:nicotinamidase/pyrazinamidase